MLLRIQQYTPKQTNQPNRTVPQSTGTATVGLPHGSSALENSHRDTINGRLLPPAVLHDSPTTIHTNMYDITSRPNPVLLVYTGSIVVDIHNCTGTPSTVGTTSGGWRVDGATD